MLCQELHWHCKTLQISPARNHTSPRCCWRSRALQQLFISIPAAREGRSLPKHELPPADAGYLHSSTANKNKLLLKCRVGRETGFTSFAQSVLAKDISGGKKKQPEKQALVVCGGMQSVAAAAAEAVAGQLPVPAATGQVTSSALCRAQGSLHM